MNRKYTTPRTEQEKVLNIYQVLGPSGDMGVSNTPPDPVYPGGGD